jgi:hypothetical protein
MDNVQNCGSYNISWFTIWPRNSCPTERFLTVYNDSRHMLTELLDSLSERPTTKSLGCIIWGEAAECYAIQENYCP